MINNICGCIEGKGGVCPICWIFKQSRSQYAHSTKCERPGCDGSGLITLIHNKCSHCPDDTFHSPEVVH